MKILICSDSHGDTQSLLMAVDASGAQMLLFMGDGVRDCRRVAENCPDLAIRKVRGNCDISASDPVSDEFEIEGKKIFMTHGHEYNVKCGTGALVNSAMCRGVDVLLFGHTHRPSYELYDGLHIINPGSIGSSAHTYGVLEICAGTVSYRSFSLRDI